MSVNMVSIYYMSLSGSNTDINNYEDNEAIAQALLVSDKRSVDWGRYVEGPPFFSF